MFVTYILYIRDRYSISLLLTLLVMLTIIFSYLIGKTPLIDTPRRLILTLLSGFLLILLIDGYRKYVNVKYIIPNYNQQSFDNINKFILAFGLLTLFVNVYIVYKSVYLLLNASIDITSFKNEGGAAEYIDGIVNGKILFISRLLTPLGYIALPLHFHYLKNRKLLISLIFLLISLNIPIQGLQALSRAATVQYVALYLTILLVFFKSLPTKYKSKITYFLVIVLFLLVTVLGIITTNRFSGYYNVSNESIIKDPVLFSLLDYASQWNQYSIEVMDSYTLDKTLFGKSSLALFEFILDKIGYNPETLNNARTRVYGSFYSTKFNGLTTVLLYDFSYVGSLIFAFGYRYIIKKASPINGVQKFTDFVHSTVLLMIPLMFYANNYLSYVIYDISIIYMLLYTYLIRKKFTLR